MVKNTTNDIHRKNDITLRTTQYIVMKKLMDFRYIVSLYKNFEIYLSEI